ncbi:MAG: type 1 glutamine amidotransferase [Acidimicrobiales bacterium]
MRVLVVRHHEEDSAGLIGEAFAGRGAELTTHLFPADGPLPSADGFDHVVLLGAKWSIYDRDSVGSWIESELDWLQRADESGIPVLGICFGAQALTTAFGGVVERAPAVELGWKCVSPSGNGTLLDILGPGPWFQFHEDRCVLPEGAVLHAENGTGVQVFSIGRNLGVQFHPEIDGEQLSGWLDDETRQMLENAGIDPDGLVAETVAMESESRLRAVAVVGAALALAHTAERPDEAPSRSRGAQEEVVVTAPGARRSDLG